MAARKSSCVRITPQISFLKVSTGWAYRRKSLIVISLLISGWWLAVLFDAPAILAGYSRLVIDFDRPLDDHTSVRVISDNTVIPVNRRLSPMQLDARADAFFQPYHQAITDAIEARQNGTRCPVVISFHSYTDAAGLPKDTGSTVVSMISAKASASHMPISSKRSLHWCGRMPNDLTVSRRSRERVKSSPMEQAHTSRFWFIREQRGKALTRAKR